MGNDMVNHPAHYKMGKFEVIDVIEDWQLEFHEANVIKYVARAKHKNKRLEDLKKAAWYLNRKIEMLESLEKCPVEVTDYLDDEQPTLVTDLIKERGAKDG